MMMMRRYGPRMGPAGLLMGGRKTMVALAAGYVAKKVFDAATKNRRTRRA